MKKSAAFSLLLFLGQSQTTNSANHNFEALITLENALKVLEDKQFHNFLAKK